MLSYKHGSRETRFLEGHSEAVCLIDCCMIVSLKSCLHTKRYEGASHQSWKVEGGRERYNRGEPGSIDCLFFTQRTKGRECLCCLCAAKDSEGKY